MVKHTQPGTASPCNFVRIYQEHRGLLKHPVISSFLLMKWQRIRTFYLVSLVIYFLFVVSLTLLILVGKMQLHSTLLKGLYDNFMHMIQLFEIIIYSRSL